MVTTSSVRRPAANIVSPRDDDMGTSSYFFATNKYESNHHGKHDVYSYRLTLFVLDEYNQLIQLIWNIDMSNQAKIFADLERIAGVIPSPMLWTDKNGVGLGCNDLVVQQIGATESREQLIGKTPYEYAPKEIADDIIKNVNRVIQEKRRITFEEIIKDINTGETKYLLMARCPLFDDSGTEVIGTIVSGTDITAKKRAERLEIEKEAAQQASQVVKEWAGGLISQILTISSTIAANSNEARKLCTNSNDQPANIEQIAPLIDKISHSICNINNAISLSVFKLNKNLAAQDRVDAKKTHDTDITSCVHSVLNEFAFQNNGRDVMKWDSFTNENFHCNIDEFLVKNMLFSLIEDALLIIRKADNGAICINSLAGKPYNLLIFKISGSGISAKDADVLVQTYDINSKAKASPNLLLCKTIMQSYNGDIAYSAEEGKEITITFSFPACAS